MSRRGLDTNTQLSLTFIRPFIQRPGAFCSAKYAYPLNLTIVNKKKDEKSYYNYITFRIIFIVRKNIIIDQIIKSQNIFFFNMQIFSEKGEQKKNGKHEYVSESTPSTGGKKYRNR